MTTASTPAGFAFERFDVADAGSIATIFAAKEHRSGLYVLHFANNEAFVGYSDSVAAQFAADRNTWSDVEALDFTPETSDKLEQLTELVTQLTTLRERPSEPDAIGDAPSAKSALPKERAKRATLQNAAVGRSRRQFWELSDHIAYPAIRSIVADYINSSIPDPANTAKYLWQVGALSDQHDEAGPRRLLTLSCGGFETLRIDEIMHDDDAIELDLRINTNVPRDYTDGQLEISNETVSAGRGPYRDERVWSWSIDLGALLEEDVDVDLGIDDDTFDDLAYGLNARLMRSGKSTGAATHNHDLAADLLAEAYRQLSETE
ncbi:putative uncharacterized protein [Rhodococcus sp. AW25M09]|uniref:hypothetical protein n=1 Tax=Rhodococcus sp. AW25M09 TaxID=1268303 RepID=UPI0002AC9C60|nr:hypothetical protein [Rhodococcus sp. AW25M09]CCQ15549.1 putative uncharacterized protein [Rhodococcus sp. AW25M09]